MAGLRGSLKHIMVNVLRKISLIGFVYLCFDIAFVCNTRHDECVITQLLRPYVPSRKLRLKDVRLHLIPSYNLERYGRQTFSISTL